MRTAVIELAFAGLRAAVVTSGALAGNIASARVSEKLGYRRDGEDFVSPRGVPIPRQKFRLERSRWDEREHVPVAITGLEPCLPLFGATSRASRAAARA